MVKVKSNRSKLSSVEENIHLVDKDLESDITLSRPVQDKRKKKTLLLSGGLAVLGLTATLGYLGQPENNDVGASNTTPTVNSGASTFNSGASTFNSGASTFNSGLEDILSKLDDATEYEYFQAADADEDEHVTKEELQDFISEQMESEPHALEQCKTCINKVWPLNVDSFVVGEEELKTFESDWKDCIHNMIQSSRSTDLALEDTHRYVVGESQLTHLTQEEKQMLYETMHQSGNVNKDIIKGMIIQVVTDYSVEQKLIQCVDQLYPQDKDDEDVENMNESQFHTLLSDVTDCETAIVPHSNVNAKDAQKNAVLNASPEDVALFFETIGASEQDLFTLDEVLEDVEKFFNSDFADDMEMCIESEWPADVESMHISEMEEFMPAVQECLEEDSEDADDEE